MAIARRLLHDERIGDCLACARSGTTGSLLLALLEATPVAVVAVDPSDRVVLWNRAAAALFGWSAEEVVGRPSPVSVADAVSTPGSLLARALAGEASLDVPAQRRRRDGTLVEVGVSAAPIPDDAGGTAGVVAMYVQAAPRGSAEPSASAALALFDAFFEHTPTPAFLKDGEGRYVLVNDAWCRYYGAGRGEVLGRTDEELREPGTAALFRANDALVRERGTPLETTELVQLPTGAVFHQVAKFPLALADGPAHVGGVAVDVTALVEARRAAADAERRYRSLVDGAPAGVVRVDADGRFLQVNPAFCALMGYPEVELAGRLFTEVTHPDDRAKDMARYRASLAEGEPVARFRKRYVRRDGETIWAQVSTSHVEDGGVVAHVEDVTALVHAEDELRASELRFRALVESSPTGIFETGQAGDCTYVNPAWCRLAGMSPDQAAGSGWVEAIHPDDRDAVAAAWYAAADSGQQFHLEYRFRSPAGDVSWLSGNATALRGPDGEITGYLGTVQDVSERKRAEEERAVLAERLEYVQRLEGLATLAGGVAHDFNNLLTGVLGWAEVALAQLPPGHEAAESVARITEAGERAAALTRQMLAYSGKGAMAVAPIVLDDLLRQLGPLLETAAGSEVAVRLAPAADALVTGDGAQLRQLVTNLVANAAESYDGGPGLVTVSTAFVHADRELLATMRVDDDLPEGQYAAITVADTGSGIRPELVDRVFDPFVTTRFTGRGLGLSAVLGIVRGHRGGIRMTSEPGAGTSVLVLLPATPVPPPVATEDEREPGRLRTVLVVDDEARIRALAAAILESAGLEVLTARDGRDALGVLDSRSDVDAILLDVTMPTLDGRGTLAALRQRGRTIPVVLSSGYAADATLLEPPVTGFLAKPYLRAELLDALAQATAASRAGTGSRAG